MTRRFVAVLFAAAAVVASNSPGRGQAGRAFTSNFTLQDFAARRAHSTTRSGPTRLR